MIDDLITWLRAQLDEEERVAANFIHCDGCRGGSEYAGTMHGCDIDDARKLVLRDVATKRHILETITILSTPVPTPPGYPAAARRIKLEVESSEEQAAEVLAWILAQPYARRPGYRPEWKPTPDPNGAPR